MSYLSQLFAHSKFLNPLLSLIILSWGILIDRKKIVRIALPTMEFEATTVHTHATLSYIEWKQEQIRLKLITLYCIDADDTV